MPSAYTDVCFSNAPQGGITATKLNLLVDDLSTAIAAGGGGGTGAGDMTKAVYDTNNNGKVDTCDSLPWSAISGKPSTFPPDNTAMLKSVYDTDNNNIVDHSALADSVPWTGVTGKPATFPPDPHQASHLDNGTDVIPVASTTRTGLAPIRPGTATTYLNGAGAYTTPSGTVPSAHGATHAGGGSDPVPVATTTVAGLAPAKPNAGINATTTQVVMGDDTRLSDARTPSSTLAHQASHVTGSDQIPSASTTVRGLMPVANNVANNFYASDATQKQVTYAMLGGSQPAPVVHAPSHKSGGGDAIKLDEFAAPTDIVTLNASTTAHGLLPKLAGGTSSFLRADGTWAAPAGGGDMTKAVYDTNADNIVDHAALADAAPWTGITGKPSTFPPDATAELVARKAVASGYASLDAGTKVPVAQLPVVAAAAAGIAPSPASAAFSVLSTDTSGNPAWSDLTGQVFGMYTQDVLFDDFISRVDATTTTGAQIDWHYGWTVFLSGAGTQVNSGPTIGVDSFNKAFGVLVNSTGSTASANSTVFMPNGFKAGLGALDIYYRIAILSVPTAAQQVGYWWGLSPVSAGALNTAAGGVFINLFWDTSSSSVRWFGSVSDGTEVDTAKVASPAVVAYSASSLTFYKLQISINAAWNSVSFFVNGVQIGAALTTHIPLTTVLAPSISITKSVGLTTGSVYTDKLFMRYQRGAM